MPIVKLSSQLVATATCPAGKRRVDLYDDGLNAQGLLVEVRSSGSKSFAVRFIDGYGKTRQVSLGGTTDISFAQAVMAARKLRAEAVLGGDPLADRAQKKAVPCWGDLADQHLAFVKPTLRSYCTMETAVRVHLKPRFGRMPIDSITEQHVVRFLADKADAGMAPASCERLRVVLGRSFELAKRWRLPGSGGNPARGIPRQLISNARTPSLSPAQLEALRDAVARSSNTQLKYIVGLLLLCGCRLRELLHARWEDIDLDGRTFHVRKAKNGHARFVPLAQAAIDLLGEVPRFDGCPYVVPNPATKKPFTTLKSAWRVVVKRAKLPGLRQHDLRHISASHLIRGADLFTVGKILGHRDYRSTQRYAHLANDSLLAAVDAGAAKLGIDWT